MHDIFQRGILRGRNVGYRQRPIEPQEPIGVVLALPDGPEAVDVGVVEPGAEVSAMVF